MRIRDLVSGIVALAAVCTLAGSRTALAQEPVLLPSDNTAYGTTAAEFLLFPASARGAALGNAYSALATDLSAMHFNPSGLALLQRPGIEASSMSYVAETSYNWVGFGFPMSGGSRAFGFSLATFGFSDQPVYTVEDPTGASGEVYSVRQTAISGTYAQRFSDRFSAGLTAKLINDQLGRTSGTAFAIDFGTTFLAQVGGRALRAAFTVQNLGTNLKHTGNGLDVFVVRDPPPGQQEVPQQPADATLKAKDWPLPVMFRVAVAYDAFATSASRLSVLGEFNQPNNSDPGFNFAGEYNMNLGRSGFALAGRVGYTFAPDNNLDPVSSTSADYAGFDTGVSAGMDGFSAGGGIRWAGRAVAVNFDYAYRDLGFLGGVNMISVGFGW